MVDVDNILRRIRSNYDNIVVKSKLCGNRVAMNVVYKDKILFILYDNNDRKVMLSYYRGENGQVDLLPKPCSTATDDEFYKAMVDYFFKR